MIKMAFKEIWGDLFVLGGVSHHDVYQAYMK